ncbi:MAG TPA: oxidoreductase, partial [Polyangia bacterium]|nr:oxidoreductase [Polyangia bacterium]
MLDLSETTRLVELEPAESLDFVGGQYIIVNSGITLPDGKVAKRAYSFVSADTR